MDFWLYPGAYVNVSAPTKVTMTPVALGEMPAPGITIIPPQSPLPPSVALIRAAEAANQQVLASAAAANQTVQEQAAAANQAVQAAGQVNPAPPWEVTFTEKR